MVTIETEEEFQFVQDLLKKTLNVSGPETWCRQQNNSVCLALNLTRHGGRFRWGQGRPLAISPIWSPNLEESGDCVTCGDESSKYIAYSFVCDNKHDCPNGRDEACSKKTYVNDGTQDCPQGEDENNLMLKCFNTSQYVFLEKVCDGFKDCPRGDDEINCHIECPNGAYCTAGVLGPNIPVEKCESNDKSISSCTHLIRGVSMRIILWAIGLMALLGNVFALAYRMIWDRKVLHTVYGQSVSNLCISDMIMGFYLIVIGVADEVYRDNYFAHEEEWQYGVVCQVAGFLSTLSSEVTTFFICLITLDRYLTLRFQTGKYRFTTRTKRASIILSWLLGFTLALVPVLCSEWGIFTSNSMCLAFPLDTAVSGGRYYAVALFLGLNFVLFLYIMVGQILILRSLSARRYVSTFSTVNNSRRIQDVLVARQLSLVAVTNFLAWVPVQIMGTLALAGIELDDDVYVWTAVFVLPLNSALNPLIYSFPRLYNLFQSLKNFCCK
ncbi:G-protein coupled receptor GRL101-like [Physella acuta]|uniref:G-protein coupled receptor GRL101-like n=1 Tax=Physella acuta TaxID=109671 RepID=UPI0027DC572B|nr:G-protein coupled receptor GRL101-like [Physella acuta]